MHYYTLQSLPQGGTLAEIRTSGYTSTKLIPTLMEWSYDFDVTDVWVEQGSIFIYTDMTEAELHNELSGIAALESLLCIFTFEHVPFTMKTPHVPITCVPLDDDKTVYELHAQNSRKDDTSCPYIVYNALLQRNITPVINDNGRVQLTKDELETLITQPVFGVAFRNVPNDMETSEEQEVRELRNPQPEFTARVIANINDMNASIDTLHVFTIYFTTTEDMLADMKRKLAEQYTDAVIDITYDPTSIVRTFVAHVQVDGVMSEYTLHCNKIAQLIPQFIFAPLSV